MTVVRHGYALEILRDDGHTIEQVAITPDWQPAVDWTHFDGVRAGVLPAITRTDPGTIEPVWDTRIGAPYVAAFRITVEHGAGGPTVTREIPRRYLHRLAGEVSADVVRRHAIPAGTDLRWVVRADPASAVEGDAPDDFCSVVPHAQPWPITEAPLARFLAAATPSGTPGVPADADAMPVFIARAVLDAAHTRARDTPDVESGGVLAGTLHRDDTDAATLFLEITALLPAAHGVAATTAFTFTADTWATAHAALTARGVGESLAGWMHSHLNWCRVRGCPEERWASCTGAQPFFSAEDVHLHATCFPAGWQVGLLISDSPAAGGLAASLYGWSDGLVVPRPFHVLD